MYQASPEGGPPRLPLRPPRPPLPPRPNTKSHSTAHSADPALSPGGSTHDTRSVTPHSSKISTRPHSRYPNAPIDPQGEIRIVQLMPGSYSDPIRCKLGETSQVSRTTDAEHPEIGDVPSYEALSYTWGGWDNLKTIWFARIDNFPVTQNLWAALKRLRSTNDTRELWIDQLSINQDDAEEKAKQVALMGEIYRQARQVVLWIGDVPDDDFATSTNSKSRLRTHLKRAIDTANPSWFTRTWVLQEFIMAQYDPLVCFGPYSFGWPEFFQIAFSAPTSLLGLAGKLLLKGLTGNKQLLSFDYQLLTFLQMRQEAKTQPLLTWAWTISQLDCSIAKDKVYSLLAVLPEGERALIEVDYQKSDALVFAEATCASITNSGSFTILILASQDRSAQTSSPPSWIADFSRAWTMLAPERADEMIWSSRTQETFNEGLAPLLMLEKGKKLNGLSTRAYSWSSRQPTSQAQFHFNPESLTLTIKALRFDEVAYTVVSNDFRKLKTWSTFLSTANSIIRRKWVPCLATVDQAYERLEAANHQQSTANKPSPPQSYSICPHCSTPFTLISITLHIATWEDAHPPPQQSQHENGATIDVDFYQDNVFPNDRKLMGAFVTASGLLGLGSQSMQPGDEIVLPYGARFPMVLRKVASVGQKKEEWRFLGFAHIYGIMQGEIAIKMPEVEFEEREYILC